jgi:transposase
MGHRLTRIKICVPKFRCKRCGIYFRQSLPGVLAYQRATESFRMDVATKHHMGFSKDAAAKVFRISHSKVDRCYQHIYSKQMAERKNRPCPRVMGIDEHFLNRRTGFVTTLVDLKSRRVFDLLPARSQAGLHTHLMQLKGRDRVRVIVMDLSSTYRSVVTKYFPNATIVSDRFHVVRLINHSLMELWKSLDEQGRKNRGLASLMRRHRYKLSDTQRTLMARYFTDLPALGICYHRLKELSELMLFKEVSKSQARHLIRRLFEILADFKSTPLQPLLRLAATIESWLEPIAHMWRFSKTNSITEGLHCKMEVIQRRAYGFHSFKNYRIRVLALCG